MTGTTAESVRLRSAAFEWARRPVTDLDPVTLPVWVMAPALTVNRPDGPLLAPVALAAPIESDETTSAATAVSGTASARGRRVRAMGRSLYSHVAGPSTPTVAGLYCEQRNPEHPLTDHCL